MASMLLSTMSMFLSDGAMLLFILILAGFFLFYTDAYGWKEKLKKWKLEHAKKSGEEKAVYSSELEKLKVLKNAGLLSEEEYREHKREIDSL